MATPARAPAGDRPLTGDRVEAMGWERFRRWFRDQWKTGEHVALIGPTGTGKSTFACHLVGPKVANRWYVLALDPKGGDSTLASSELFERLPAWPPPRAVRRDIAEGRRPVRLVVGPVVRSTADRERLVAAQRAALVGAFDEGGWTVYVDELQVATSPKGDMRLGPEVERLLVAARDKRVSLVTAYQAPRWVPTAASDQATWVGMWRTRDTHVVDRMAEVLGRDRLLLRAAVANIGKHDVLVGGRDLSVPLVVTNPPPILPRRQPRTS